MKLMDYLFPPTCVACGAKLGDTWPLCPFCLGEWEFAKTRCRAYSEGIPVRVFGEGFDERAGSAVHLVHYVPSRTKAPENRLILSLKTKKNPRLARFAADDMAALLRMSLTKPLLRDAVVTWIPRSVTNRVRYGFDHMEAVARETAISLGLPSAALLRRTMLAGEQKLLNAAERRENAARTIRIRRNVALHGRTVVLLDDIITTGASMEACARLLLDAGAGMVIAAAIASTGRESKPKRIDEVFTVKPPTRS